MSINEEYFPALNIFAETIFPTITKTTPIIITIPTIFDTMLYFKPLSVSFGIVNVNIKNITANTP